jgi:hypothetical protein
MKCRHAKKLIFDHIDGMISDQDRLGLERHLSECGSCEVMASGLDKSLDLLHRLPPVEPDENFNWKLRLRLAKERNALRTDAGSERLWFKWWNTRFAISALSTFVVVVAAGFVLLRSGLGPGTDSAPRGIRWDAMPEVAETVRQKKSHPQTPTRSVVSPISTVTLDVPRAFGPIPIAVSSGYPVDGPVMNNVKPVLDLDALMARVLQSQREAYRIRQLEQQVELLQTELEKCGVKQE